MLKPIGESRNQLRLELVPSQRQIQKIPNSHGSGGGTGGPASERGRRRHTPGTGRQ